MMARRVPVDAVRVDQWPHGKLATAPLSSQQRVRRTSLVVPAAGVGVDVDNVMNSPTSDILQLQARATVPVLEIRSLS